MIATHMLGQEEPRPEEVTIPGQVDQSAIDAANEKARRQRVMMIGGTVVVAVVVLGALALVGLTAEQRTHVDRHPLRAGQRRCIGHVKYRVVNDYGRLQKIGTC